MGEGLADKKLIMAAKKGDVNALSAIISTYQPAIYSHLYRLVNNPDDAADLAQETFIKLYKNRAKIDLDKNFNAWLYKIATNTAYDWFKKKKSRPEDLIIDDANVNFETIEAEQSYYQMTEIDRVGLDMALEEIKPAARNLLLLHYQQGFTYQEISEITGLPLNTVKIGLYRARKDILKSLS